MEPNNRPWILVLDAAMKRPDVPGFDTLMTSELQWVANRPVTDLLRYRVESHPDFRHGPRNNVAAVLPQYTELPAGFNPRTLALAREMRQDPAVAGRGQAALVQAALNRLRTGNYQYTLDPGVYGADTADEFWFDRKEGFCEHIASAFVVLMRAMDIPARVVTGYQGGERNAVDGFWVVRQSDAHAWTEVWLAGRGWVRVDPTSAVAPGRTGSFQRLQPPRGVIATAFGTVTPNLAASLRAGWEALNNGWNQWVLNYTQSRQLDLLKNLGFQSPSWEDLTYVLLGLLVFVALCGAAWTLWERRQHDPWLRLLARTRKRLRDAGLELPPAAPPRQIATLVTGRFGEQRPVAGRLAAEAGNAALRPHARREPGRAPARIQTPCLAPLMPRILLAATLFVAAAALAAPLTAQTARKRAVAERNNQRGVPYAAHEEAMRWADDVAQRRDLDRDWVRQAVGRAQFLPLVSKLMQPPPVGTPKNWRVVPQPLHRPGAHPRRREVLAGQPGPAGARRAGVRRAARKSSSASSAWRRSTASRPATSA